MFLPRPLLSNLYTSLLSTQHPSAPPVLILTALSVDALCATRILSALFKRDFIPHKIRPISGYADLMAAGEEEVRGMMRGGGGQGGTVVCLGCGGGVDLGEMLLGLGGDEEEVRGEQGHGVEAWVVDAHRPWNLENVFGTSAVADGMPARRGVKEGKIGEAYRPGVGGVIVWDEGDIERDLEAEREVWWALQGMPEISEEDLLADAEEEEDAEGGARDDEVLGSSQTRKRKADSQDDVDEDMSDADEASRPTRRRRSNSGSAISSSFQDAPPSSQPDSAGAVPNTIPSSPPKALTQRQLRKQLLKLRQKHEKTLEAYYDRGSTTGEPVSSMLYSLASELGREDNELLWLAIVGVESVALSPFTCAASSSGENGRKGVQSKLELVKAVLRDEVRRLNPMSEMEMRRGSSVAGDIPTTARSATDTSIRLSPEPRFLLIRHWSLIDSMMHSPYLATRLHIWNEPGRKRLNKLLAKMGISLQEAGKGYLHLDLTVKRSLRQRVGKWAESYGLEGLVPEDADGGGVGWGFVRSWGWRGTLSAVDVATVVSAILEVGPHADELGVREGGRGEVGYNHRAQGLPSPPHSSDSGHDDPAAGAGTDVPDWTTRRFYLAYDALSPTTSTASNTHGSHTHQQGLPALLSHIPTAQSLARAILRTGSALVSKHAIRHLRSFRMGVVKEGPDLGVFSHPGALVKLAGWVGEAVSVLEAEKTGRRAGDGGKKGEDSALVLACLDDARGVYVVVGVGGGGVGHRPRVKTKAEVKEREERRKRRVADKVAKKAERARLRAERKQAKRERDAANGLLDSDDDEGEGSEATESDASSTSSTSTSSTSSSDDDNDSGADDSGRRRRRGGARNRFGVAFQEVVAETGARVRIDSFEHSVVEVRKEDLAGFLEGLSLRSVVG